MSWATPQDIRDRWVGTGAPTVDDDTLVTSLIADAETVILAEYPRIQERIDAATLAVETVVMVVCRMVTRMMRNPEGLTYQQNSTGPFSQAKNYGNAERTDIWLSADEIKLLAPKRQGKAYEVDVAPNAYPGLPIPPYVTETTFGPYYTMIENGED